MPLPGEGVTKTPVGETGALTQTAAIENKDPVGVLDRFVVAAVAVGLLETKDRQARLVVAIDRFLAVDPAVRSDETFEILQAAGDHRVVGGQAVAHDRGGHQGGHSGAGIRGVGTVGRLALGPQESHRPLGRLAVRLRVGLGVGLGIGVGRCGQGQTEGEQQKEGRLSSQHHGDLVG